MSTRTKIMGGGPNRRFERCGAPRATPGAQTRSPGVAKRELRPRREPAVGCRDARAKPERLSGNQFETAVKSLSQTITERSGYPATSTFHSGFITWLRRARAGDKAAVRWARDESDRFAGFRHTCRVFGLSFIKRDLIRDEWI